MSTDNPTRRRTAQQRSRELRRFVKVNEKRARWRHASPSWRRERRAQERAATADTLAQQVEQWQTRRSRPRRASPSIRPPPVSASPTRSSTRPHGGRTRDSPKRTARVLRCAPERGRTTRARRRSCCVRILHRSGRGSAPAPAAPAAPQAAPPAHRRPHHRTPNGARSRFLGAPAAVDLGNLDLAPTAAPGRSSKTKLF
jgi:hypothetical protein